MPGVSFLQGNISVVQFEDRMSDKRVKEEVNLWTGTTQSGWFETFAGCNSSKLFRMLP